MENTPTQNPLVNTPLTELDRVVDSPHVLLLAVEKDGMGAMEPIMLSVFHSCFAHTLLKDRFAKTAFWVRELVTISAVTLHPKVDPQARI